METRLTRLLGIRIPVIQGGLAYLAYADLAAAVSDAGGLGQVTAMTLPSPVALREEIKKVREKTKRPFSVNFAIGQHGRPFEEMLAVAVEEGVEIVSVTGGNPKPFFDFLSDVKTKKLVLVAGVRQAQKAEELGADAVMVVGQEGGGHLGRDDLGTLILVQKVVRSVKIPVVASGGFHDGRGLMAALALGAEGIEMGTRFIATKECVDAHPVYKEAILKAKETDTTVIKRSLGAPARALTNPVTERILSLEAEGAGYDGLKELISGKSNTRLIHEGKWDEGYGWAGQVVGLIDDIPSVGELLKRMEEETEAVLNRLTHMIHPLG